MIISMSDIICVTNRALCREDFLMRLEKIAMCHPAGIILREKDLSEKEYRHLAKKVIEFCEVYQVPCVLHSFINIAIELKANAIHLPLPVLREMTDEQKSYFQIIGASCHSVEDAREAEYLGCTYITAGHIFDTDCKKGLPGRGTDFLMDVCENVSIPVYAIGGVDSTNITDVCKAGAQGACVMSGLMQCEDVKAFLESF